MFKRLKCILIQKWILNIAFLFPTIPTCFPRQVGIFCAHCVACTREQINQIADLTAEYYDQLAIMFYRVSDEVVIKEYQKGSLVGNRDKSKVAERGEP